MHLTDVAAFAKPESQEWIKRLFQLNVRHVEQLGSLLAAPEGKYALERLGVPVADIQKRIEPVLSKFGLSLSSPFEDGTKHTPSLLTRDTYAMGYEGGARDVFRDAAVEHALPIPPKGPKSEEPPKPPALPKKVSLGPRDPLTVGDQGARGTCVAFAAAGMYQLAQYSMRARPVQLSTQYRYYLARGDDGFDPDSEGTSLEAALRMLKKHGCVLDSRLPYVKRHDIRQIYRVRGHKPTTREDALRKLAKERRITAHREVTHSVEAIKAELAEKRPVGVGVPVYQLAWYNSLARSRGEIGLPLMDSSGPKPIILDRYIGGHAIVLVGFADNDAEADEESHRPGGGYFFFRNSWGENWASGNDFGRGYGCIPYEYIDRFCLEAVVIDGLVPTSPKGRATPPAAESSQADKKRATKTKTKV
jgi:hypothetical protein